MAKVCIAELTASQIRGLVRNLQEVDNNQSSAETIASVVLDVIDAVGGKLVSIQSFTDLIDAFSEIKTICTVFTDDTLERLAALNSLAGNVYKARVRVEYTISTKGGKEYYSALDFDVLATQASPDSPWAEIM